MNRAPFTKFWMPLFGFSIMLFSGFGCEKDYGENSVPNVDAGENQFVLLPDDACQLAGSVYDMQKNIVSYSWRKIAGPSGYVFENSNILDAKVHDLQKGRYEFELTATDKGGLKDSDTVAVSVIDVGENEVYFEDLDWVCPMNCSVVVKKIYSHVPRNVSFSVFVRQEDSTSWQPATPEDPNGSFDKYVYGVHEGDLYISFAYADEFSPKYDLKIKF